MDFYEWFVMLILSLIPGKRAENLYEVLGDLIMIKSVISGMSKEKELGDLELLEIEVLKYKKVVLIQYYNKNKFWWMVAYG